MHTASADWSVTDAKVEEAARRIVAAADPLKVILFGSRARGDFRPDSDVDLAVILDGPEEDVRNRLPDGLLWGMRMEVDLIAVSEGKYELHRPWINSIYNYIDREGVVLYDRASACRNTLARNARRQMRVPPEVRGWR